MYSKKTQSNTEAAAEPTLAQAQLMLKPRLAKTMAIVPLTTVVTTPMSARRSKAISRVMSAMIGSEKRSIKEEIPITANNAQGPVWRNVLLSADATEIRSLNARRCPFY
jgi:hypothetical protein